MLYRPIFEFEVNDILEKGILPFDDVQHGAYAESHGGFDATDLGFNIFNWKYNAARKKDIV